ncbi:MAG TPA: DNA polymerase III subunit delta [Candidatus Binatus sp.]|nr:DNA polymerase III subunit delta [Candidatus Binatus sp.]
MPRAARDRGSDTNPLERLAREPLRPYYLLYGEEPFLVERALDVLRDRLIVPGRPGTRRTLWGDEDAPRLAAALADLASPPLFGGAQVLVVRRADALRDEAEAHVLEALPTLGPGGTLVLVARVADQRRRLAAACLKAGAAYGFARVDERGAAEWVARLARERKVETTPAATQDLLDRSGVDLGVLAGEIDKLALHVGEGARIEPKHVRSVVAAVRQHAVDDLTTHLARKNAAGAARALRLLLAEGEPPVRLLAFLGANFRRALHVAELSEAGLGQAEIAARLHMPPWLVGRIAGQGRARDLERSLHVLRRLDLELKSTRPAEAVFEAAVLEIVGGR